MGARTPVRDHLLMVLLCLGAAIAMLAIGTLSALAAIGIFRRRDLLGA